MIITFLLKKMLIPERGNLVSLAMWISAFGVALGVAELMVVLAIMSGFQDLFRQNYTRITSDIVVVPKSYRKDTTDLRLSLLSVKEIQNVTAFGLSAGMIVKKESVGGAVLEGIEPATSAKVTPWESIWANPPAQTSDSSTPWIWIGYQLAKKLKVQVGEKINLLVADADSRRMIPFVVTAITKFGIYHHDSHQAYIDLKTLNEIFFKTSQDPMFKIKVKEGVDEVALAEKLRTLYGKSASIKTWNEIHQNIFRAVEHQKKLLFIVLEIVVALAAMNVVNLLLMNSYQKRRDIAILRAMGMKRRSVLGFFVTQGTLVGFIGVVMGIFLGWLACMALYEWQPVMLSEAIYNTTRLPIRVQFFDVLKVCIAALFLCMLFSMLPGIRVAISRPVEALRHE